MKVCNNLFPCSLKGSKKKLCSQRVKEQHEHEEVKVTTEGALFVDNVLAFSIKDGFPKHNAAGSTSHDD